MGGYLFITIIIITAGVLSPALGFNYTEFFLNRNPYLARQLINGYEEFSAGVNSALGLPVSDQNQTDVRGDGEDDGDGLFSNSTNHRANLGVATLVALARQNIWHALKVPGLESALRSAPPALPDLMGILFKAAQEDYNTKIRTLIFTPTYVKTTLNLANLKAEIKQAFFQLPESTMDGINNVIRTRVSGVFSFPDYLTKPLPESTEALIVSIKEQKGHWPDYTTSAGRGVFRSSAESGGEMVNMFDLQGDFWYGENGNYEFITVPLKATKLQVTLILPKDLGSVVDWRVMKSISGATLSRSNLRLRLPAKTFISRGPLKFNSSGCPEEDTMVSSPCMKFLDTLTYTSFTPSQFQFVVLTGGAVNNPYVRQLRSQQGFQGLPTLERWRLILPPRKHIRRIPSSSSTRFWGSSAPSFSRSSSALSSYTSGKNSGDERLIIFDRPFHWFLRGNV